MFQFADNWEETYSCYESIKKGNNRVHDRETTSFSVLILIVLPEKKKKKESFSAILERVPRIIYNTLHKEISTFYYDCRILRLKLLFT